MRVGQIVEDKQSSVFLRKALSLPVLGHRHLENTLGLNSMFSEIDDFTTKLLKHAFSGRQLLLIEGPSGGKRNSAACFRLNLPGNASSDVLVKFQARSQQRVGAWFVPEFPLLFSTGYEDLLNFPYWIASNEAPKKNTSHRWIAGCFADNGTALYVWSVLVPLFGELILPFESIRQKPLKNWHRVWSFWKSIGIEPPQLLSELKGGTRSIPKTSSACRRLEVELLRHHFDTLNEDFARVYRIREIRVLMARYRKEARKTKELPRMRQVLASQVKLQRQETALTHALSIDLPTKSPDWLLTNEQRILCGYFEGSWIRFLEYIGAKPSSKEQYSSSVPVVRLFIETPKHIEAIAAEQGILESEMQKILASWWGSGDVQSPVQKRIAALVDMWSEFLSLHTNWCEASESLFGLLTTDREIYAKGKSSALALATVELYSSFFSATLLKRIAALWGARMLPSWPGSIVTELNPQKLAEESFGPLIQLWHGLAVKAWIHSRTGIPLRDLNLIFSPFYLPDSDDLRLFRDVALQVETRTNRNHVEDYKTLHEIILSGMTESSKSLRQYLEARCHSGLSVLARQFYLRNELKGRPLTVKQFAKIAEDPVNQWFGGNLSDLYCSFGERSPVTPARRKCVPEDRNRFLKSIHMKLNENPIYRNSEELVHHSLRYLQLREAIGHSPSVTAFGEHQFNSCVRSRIKNVRTKAWEDFTRLIEDILKDFHE